MMTAGNLFFASKLGGTCTMNWRLKPPSCTFSARSHGANGAEAFLLAAETPMAGQIWNLGAGNPQSVNRLVELIGGPMTHIPKRPGEPDVTWADIGKITRDLGWRPKIPFDEGVGKMMAEIDKWRDAPLWDPESIARATRIWFDYLGPREVA